MTDPRFAVRDGLRRLLDADANAWPGPTPLVFRGRLLDEVGSDARPLVQLLQSVAERGVVARMRDALANGQRFGDVRGPLVVQLTDEAFLRREMAQWAVETWGYALGLATLADLTPGVGRVVPPRAPAPVRAAVPAVTSPAGSAAARTAAPRPMLTPTATAMRPAYRPANAPPGYRPPRPAVGPLGVRSGPSGLSPRTVRTLVLGVGAFCIAAVALFFAVGLPSRGMNRDVTRARDVTPSRDVPVDVPVVAAAPVAARRAPDASRIGIPVLPPALPGVTRGALPSSAGDSAQLVYVRPPLRAPTAPPADRPGLGVPNVGTGKLDRLVKRNGDVLVGRVEVVRASEVQFLESDSRLRYAVPKREIAEIVTEFGNRIRFDGKTVASSSLAMGPVVRRGVGGTYNVTYRVSSVTGSPECSRLWQRPPAPDLLTVTHNPGADTLVLRADQGGTFSAVIDPAANFSTSLLPQTEASVGSSAITSRMTGTFRANSFTGEVSIIGYRRQPTGRDVSCYSILAVEGRRTAP
jgi:hypothetical protein